MIVVTGPFDRADNFRTRVQCRARGKAGLQIVSRVYEMTMFGAVFVPNQHEMQQYGEVGNANQNRAHDRELARSTPPLRTAVGG
jgi:hypothetical protein